MERKPKKSQEPMRMPRCRIEEFNYSEIGESLPWDH